MKVVPCCCIGPEFITSACLQETQLLIVSIVWRRWFCGHLPSAFPSQLDRCKKEPVQTVQLTNSLHMNVYRFKMSEASTILIGPTHRMYHLGISLSLRHFLCSHGVWNQSFRQWRHFALNLAMWDDSSPSCLAVAGKTSAGEALSGLSGTASWSCLLWRCNRSGLEAGRPFAPSSSVSRVSFREVRSSVRFGWTGGLRLRWHWVHCFGQLQWNAAYEGGHTVCVSLRHEKLRLGLSRSHTAAVRTLLRNLFLQKLLKSHVSWHVLETSPTMSQKSLQRAAYADLACPCKDVLNPWKKLNNLTMLGNWEQKPLQTNLSDSLRGRSWEFKDQAHQILL